MIKPVAAFKELPVKQRATVMCALCIIKYSETHLCYLLEQPSSKLEWRVVRLNRGRLLSWLALWWKAKMHSGRNVEIPRKEWGNPQAACGITGTHLFPLLICSEPIMVFIEPYCSLILPNSSVYTFILEKPQLDMEVQLQSTIWLTHRGAFLHQRTEKVPWESVSPFSASAFPGYFVWWSLAVQIHKTFQLNRISSLFLFLFFHWRCTFLMSHFILT